MLYFCFLLYIFLVYISVIKGQKNSTCDVRLRAVKAIINGMAVTDVANAYQVDRTTIHRWVARFKNEGGPKGLIRKSVSGRPRKLRNEKELDLKSIILKPASEFGYETDFWTCRRLCQIIQEKFKIDISRWTIMRRLHEIGLTYQKPEKRYHEADPQKREEWLKKEMPKIIKTVKKYRAILYFEDEANISLTAVLAKTWAPSGETPKQKVTGKRGGVSAMSAISKSGSLIFTLHEKRIASDEVIKFLDQMLKHHKRRHIVVVMDKAKPHVSKKTIAFIDSQKRLHVFYLPSYSPDFNPDEKVWNHLKTQELKGHQAKTKEELKQLTEKKLTDMSKNKKQLRGIFFRCSIAKLLH